MDLINLVKLQKLDLKLAELNRLSEEAPRTISALDEELVAADEKVTASVAEEQEILKRRRELETQISDNDEKIKANQGRQLQAKNNDEYRAFLKEAEYLRKSNSTCEDEVLEIMVKLETLTETNKNLKSWLKEEEKRLADKKLKIKNTLKENLVGKDAMDAERQDLANQVNPRFLSAYNRLLNGRKGRVVVGITDGVCSECHMHIPPQIYNELRRNDTFLTCPHCMRIMYWTEHEDFAGF